ncbi:MAG: hypothetical protein ACK5FT_06480 [Sphingomonadales bacterium]
MNNAKSIALLAVTFLLQWLQAQKVSIDKLMLLSPVGIGTQKVIPYPGMIYLPMPFSSAEFKDVSQLDDIPSPDRIHSVALIYTRFREVDTFNQPKLNYFRFQNLKKVYPAVFEDTSIQWKIMEQRQATEKEDAMKCFHGFIILLKNEPPKVLIEKELSLIKSVIDSYHDSLTWVPEKITWKVKKVKEETGLYIPVNKNKKKQGVRYTGSFLGMREKEYKIRRDSTVLKRTGGYYARKGYFDTSVFKNVHEYNFLISRRWSNKMAVVADVTGSMSPYSTQVMLWLKNRPEVLLNGRFVFFNDGDAKPDMLKRIGSTGGIHFASTTNYDSVYLAMDRTMRAGTGGDIPENNLEAVVETLRRWPDTDTVLMIADNEASVKDMSLLKNLKKPVSVMLCGATGKIHKDYIEITKTTGGRLFVLSTELSEMKKWQNGSEVLLGGKKFEYRNGELIRKKT